MSLKEKFIKLINEYAGVYEEVTRANNFKNPLGSFIRQDISNEIKRAVTDPTYKIKGSCGAGKWTTVPWIAVFDKRITTSAQKGVYIVYLLNKDKKELYLTLNQGATTVAQGESDNVSIKFTGVAGNGSEKLLQDLRKRASDIQKQLNLENVSGIDTGSPGYDAGCIAYKKYDLSSMPNDESLFEDLHNFVELYKRYYTECFEIRHEGTLSKAEGDSKHIREIFRKWFAEQPQKNNKDVKYSDNTIDAAVRLLEAGITKLGLDKYANLNCFDITSYSEFKVVRDESYELAEKFDKSQFHGDFRNGLDFYLLFLKELAQFKELMEIFVRQLKINNDIIPGEKIYGQGYKDMPKIQNIYKHCREFNGYTLELNLQAGFHSYDSSNYINLRETWINIVPLFKETSDGNHDVIALQVVIKPDNKVDKDYPAETVDDLGLFNEQSPNGTLIKLYGDFKHEIDKYLKSKIGVFDSWEIIDEVTAIKTCDKSFFDYNGSGVPKGVCWFFDAEDLETSGNKSLSLLYNGVTYDAKVQNDSTDRRRVRIFWNAELGKLFAAYKESNAKAKFVKVHGGTFQVTLLEEESEQKNAWLLAWNPNSWDWEDLEEACEMTKRGESYSQTWSCASSNVKVGDTVYLTTLGTDNNGIIASGRAVSEQYEYEHWDEQKRAEGKKNKGIDIELDYILNPFEKTPLRQEYLKKNYPEQHWSPQASGISIQEQYVKKLYENWMNYILKIQGGEKKMTIKEQISAIESYIAAEGFNYDGNLVENFYLSLKSKPFVILAGTSGTGKTRLVSLFAKAINAKLQIVPVRPDWSDSSDLFGHIDLSGHFKPGAIIDFIKDAYETKDTPFILCLDEMNLARVEYYMSDILSVIETRKFDSSHKITSEKALVDENTCRQNDGKNLYGEIKFPENLYIVGTVNMDETTFPFSKKVLDRANTIEFSYVNLLAMPSFEKNTTVPKTLTNDFLVSEYITLNDCNASDKDYIESICTKLQRINAILEKANAHIGYRVRDEIVFYMLNNKKAELLDENVAFDNQIMQKILPRIQGSSESISKMLNELLKVCESEKYEASTKKINFMIKRYEEDGFTSYWL